MGNSALTPWENPLAANLQVTNFERQGLPVQFETGGVFPSIYLLFYIEGHELFEIEGK